MKWIAVKLCRLLAWLPAAPKLSPKEWREVADAMDGSKPVPPERRKFLKLKLFGA